MKTQQKSTTTITRLALLIALTLVIQLGGMPQPITGPLINAMLFISSYLLGWIPAVLLGTITPLVALLRGQLPAPLFPMVPFISIGNAILVGLFCLVISPMDKTKRNSPLKQIRLYIGIVIASIAKFACLSTAVYVIVPLLISHDLPAVLVYAMSIPQLVTALLGGALTIIFIEIMNRTNYEF